MIVPIILTTIRKIARIAKITPIRWTGSLRLIFPVYGVIFLLIISPQRGHVGAFGDTLFPHVGHFIKLLNFISSSYLYKVS